MIDAAVAAIRAGLPVVIPTDTVYGLACAPEREHVERLYALKGREPGRPTALVAASVQEVAAHLPELGDAAETVAHALLPGPYTLVVPNPRRRFAWLTGGSSTLGLRVPELPEETARLLEQVGAVAATSANLPGGRDPRRLEDVPTRLRDGAGAVLDGGELPGVASTVVDLTGHEPVVLREGAVPTGEALARIEAALAGQ